MARPPSSSRTAPYRQVSPRTLAFTERVLLLSLGAVLAFAGFLAALWSGAAGWLRLTVAIALVGLGVALCVLAVHTPQSTAEQHDDRQLMTVERLLLAPLALLFGAAIVLVAVDRDLALAPRLVALVVLVLPALVFGVTVLGSDRVPGRDLTGRSPTDPGSASRRRDPERRRFR